MTGAWHDAGMSSSHALTTEVLRQAWHPVALAADITPGLHRIRLLGEAWVVIRDDSGLRAFLDRCPHRRAPLSEGRLLGDGGLQCGYHGWCFDQSGHCTAIPALDTASPIPARADLTAAHDVVERWGLVWLAPEPPRAPLIDVSPPLNALLAPLRPTRDRVDPAGMIDNFLDAAHFPFVHAATFGSEQSADVDDYEVETLEWGFVGRTEHAFANHEDPGVTDGRRPLVQRRRMTYTYVPPFMVTLQLDYLDAGGTNVILFAVQPEGDGVCQIFTVFLRNDLPADRMDHAIAFEQAVLDEDLVLQRQITEPMPLDLTAEVHTRADRLTIELRRSLRTFVGMT
jgi:vanillate O-demethylase monooxygenase subunit